MSVVSSERISPIIGTSSNYPPQNPTEQMPEDLQSSRIWTYEDQVRQVFGKVNDDLVQMVKSQEGVRSTLRKHNLWIRYDMGQEEETIVSVKQFLNYVRPSIGQFFGTRDLDRAKAEIHQKIVILDNFYHNLSLSKPEPTVADEFFFIESHNAFFLDTADCIHHINRKAVDAFDCTESGRFPHFVMLRDITELGGLFHPSPADAGPAPRDDGSDAGWSDSDTELHSLLPADAKVKKD